MTVWQAIRDFIATWYWIPMLLIYAGDSNLALVGTVNMDTRSFFLNFEITSIIYEAALCNALEDTFEHDKQSSRRITLKSWQSRSAVQRGFDSVCRLVAPLL